MLIIIIKVGNKKSQMTAMTTIKPNLTSAIMFKQLVKDVGIIVIKIQIEQAFIIEIDDYIYIVFRIKYIM